MADTNNIAGSETPYPPEKLEYKSVPNELDKFSKHVTITNPLTGATGPTLIPYSYNDYNTWMSIDKNLPQLGLVNEDKILRQKMGFSSEEYQDYYQNFNRYYNIFPEIELGDTKTWVFMTRPDLFIFDNNSEKNGGPGALAGAPGTSTEGMTSIYFDPYMRYMRHMYAIILKSLTANLCDSHDFIPFLVDRTESLQLQDESIKNYEMTQMYTGYKLAYAGNGLESRTGGTMEINFREDYHCRVTKFFNTWLHYIDGVTRNIFSPRRESVYLNKLDYVCSIYQIVCDATGSNIIYFAKYTGCFPINANHSNFSHQLRGTPDNKVSVSFAYSHFDALNSQILVDFNANSRKRNEILPHSDPFLLHGEFIAGAPYIRLKDNGYGYLLTWNKPLNNLKKG